MTEEHKYKIGDKFVIEIKELPLSSDGLYYLCDGKTFYPEKTLDTLPQFPNNEDSNDLYMLTQEEKSVIEERNLNYIWELVKEIVNTDWTFAKARDCFGIDINGKSGFQITREIFSGNPISIKENFENWKKEKEIHIGDVVNIDACGDPKGVVIAIDETAKKARLIYEDLSWRTDEWYLKDLKKTGKHIDIAKILEEIKS